MLGKGWEHSGWSRGHLFMNVCLGVAVRARRALCGKAKQAPAPTEAGSSGGGRCAYTVELVKPADPEGTEEGWHGGGEAEAELQGAA